MKNPNSYEGTRLAGRNGTVTTGTRTPSGVTRYRRQCISVIFVTLVLAGLIIAPVSAAHDKDSWPTSTQSAPTEQDYKDLAKNLLNTHPEIKTMSEMQKAQFAYKEYVRDLRAKKSPVNSNIPRRLEYWGDYTCGWHTANLQALMRVLGVKEVHSIVADKDSWKIPVLGVSPDVNNNHQAVLVLIDGKPYTFDVWRMAVANSGKYKDPDEGPDEYNGMRIEDWNADMVSEGYVRFTADSETVDPNADIWYPSSTDAVKHIRPVNRDTQVVATGRQTITVPANSKYYENFTIPAGFTGSGLLATYDFSKKPGPSEAYVVSLLRLEPTWEAIWSVETFGEENGIQSGQTYTYGSLENKVLGPGVYMFGAKRSYIYNFNEQFAPISGSFSFFLSENSPSGSQNVKK